MPFPYAHEVVGAAAEPNGFQNVVRDAGSCRQGAVAVAVDVGRVDAVDRAIEIVDQYVD